MNDITQNDEHPFDILRSVLQSQDESDFLPEGTTINFDATPGIEIGCQTEMIFIEEHPKESGVIKIELMQALAGTYSAKIVRNRNDFQLLDWTNGDFPVLWSVIVSALSAMKHFESAKRSAQNINAVFTEPELNLFEFVRALELNPDKTTDRKKLAKGLTVRWQMDTSTIVEVGGQSHLIYIEGPFENVSVHAYYPDGQPKFLRAIVETKLLFAVKPHRATYDFDDLTSFNEVWPENECPLMRDIIRHGLEGMKRAIAIEALKNDKALIEALSETEEGHAYSDMTAT